MSDTIWSEEKKTGIVIGESAESVSSENEECDNQITLLRSLNLGLPKSYKKEDKSLQESFFDSEAVATQYSVFDDPKLAEAYKPNPKYENIHRFDPLFRWNWGEERRLLRKIDWCIMIWATVMFFSLELDRANIKQALSDNFLEDLHMSTNQYNTGQTIYYLSFLAAELPSQLISKKVGPDRWIPSQITLWSIVSICQAALKGKSSFYASRCLLGLLEAGFIPDAILYLSYFYTSSELNIRLAYFWVSNSVADIFAAFVAVGLLKMRGLHGLEGWRYLYLIEGFITMAIGLLSFGMMPSGPCATASKFRGKEGWFSEREEKIIVNKVLRDDPSKGDMHNRQALTLPLLWKSICDYHLWPIYAIAIVFLVPFFTPAAYLTLILKKLGFDTTETNLLVLPSTFLHIFTLLGLNYLSEWLNEKSLIAMLAQIWALPLVILLYVLPASTNRWINYAILTLLIGAPFAHGLQVGWISQNSNAVRTRTVSASLYNISAQIATIISANLYKANDAPLYRKGNRDLIVIVSVSIFLYLFAKTYYVLVNRNRDKKWDRMTKEEQLHYSLTTKDEGNKRLDFRFLH